MLFYKLKYYITNFKKIIVNSCISWIGTIFNNFLSTNEYIDYNASRERQKQKSQSRLFSKLSFKNLWKFEHQRYQKKRRFNKGTRIQK